MNVLRLLLFTFPSWSSNIQEYTDVFQQVLCVLTVFSPKRYTPLKGGFRGVFFKSSYLHEYSSKNVRRRFKTFFIVAEKFWKKIYGMENFFGTDINFRKWIIFVKNAEKRLKMHKKRQKSLKMEYRLGGKRVGTINLILLEVRTEIRSGRGINAP